MNQMRPRRLSIKAETPSPRSLRNKCLPDRRLFAQIPPIHTAVYELIASCGDMLAHVRQVHRSHRFLPEDANMLGLSSCTRIAELCSGTSAERCLPLHLGSCKSRTKYAAPRRKARRQAFSGACPACPGTGVYTYQGSTSRPFLPAGGCRACPPDGL